MSDSEMTGLEKQEQEANAVLGSPSMLGSGNSKVLLERSGTNKVTAGSEQSELRIAWLGFYHYLDNRDNMLDASGYGINDHVKHFKEDPDRKHPGATVRKYFRIPYWDWMLRVLDDNVIEHQLTLWGYSREQFLNHDIAVSGSLSKRDEGGGGGGLFQWIQQRMGG